MVPHLHEVGTLYHNFKCTPLYKLFHIHIVWRAVKWKPNTRHKTHSLQKLATLLLHIDTAISGIGDCLVKTHRSGQLFLYCSGGGRSVKCVHPALEMEASKQKQRGVVRFLVAEGAGAHEIHRISAVYAEHCMSLTRVAEEIPQRTHIIARQFVSRTGPSSHNSWCEFSDWWSDSGKPTNHRGTNSCFRSALAMALCMPLSKITCSFEKFACIGFHINWRRDKWLTEWLHVWVICSGTTRESMHFSRVSSHGTKHGANNLNLRANGKANSGNTSIVPCQRNSKLSIRVQIKS